MTLPITTLLRYPFLLLAQITSYIQSRLTTLSTCNPQSADLSQVNCSSKAPLILLMLDTHPVCETFYCILQMLTGARRPTT
ncbi:hypothetical protein F4604DRAFT_1735122 [Suillus subluteus]|nr:hypothetical protein F4604DRAFT_1735122 [Suillus subluteus]